MSQIYYYAKNDALEVYLKYGIRLSKNFDKTFNINGYEKEYLIGLLNPKDDMTKYNSQNHTCIKLDVLDSHLIVADFDVSSSDIQIKNHTPIDQYLFGSYRNPRVLIDSSIISDKISLYDKTMDIPLLYDNSEDFFYEVQIQRKMEELDLKEIYERLNNN